MYATVCMLSTLLLDIIPNLKTRQKTPSQRWPVNKMIQYGILSLDPIEIVAGESHKVWDGAPYCDSAETATCLVISV